MTEWWITRPMAAAVAILCAEAVISTYPLPVHLLDGPAADLQLLGQFPLAHSLRPLHLDVLPLLLGQAGPPARETPLGPRLRLAGDRAVPDCLMRAPSVERGGGKNGWADGLTGGALRAGLEPPTKNIRRAALGAGLGRFHYRAGTDRGRPLRRTPQALGVVGPRTASKGKWCKFAQFFYLGGKRPRCCG